MLAATLPLPLIAPVPMTATGEIVWPQPDPTSPFFITGPALISFSGGRTSALMLFLILWAHGGQLPADVHVCFANTGRERAETLRFVHECGVRWGVMIHWLEWRPPPPRRAKRQPGEPARPRRASAEYAAECLEEVGFNSADRTGKWFAELMRRKQYLPNATMRYCTTELKIRVMKHFMIARGYGRWINTVGLRADEPHRVMKQVLIALDPRERFLSISPLFLAGITKRSVMAFWLGQNVDSKLLTHPLPMGFDLGLRDYEGNCDLCFLKGRGKKARIIRENPGVEEWWIEQETLSTARTRLTPYAKRFDKDESFEQLARAIAASPELADIMDDGREYDSECGVSCIGEELNEPIADEALDWLREQMTRIAREGPKPLKARQKLPAVIADLYPEEAA